MAVKHAEGSAEEEINALNRIFVDELSQDYRLIEKIGEGTFSSVFKAADLKYEQYTNQWDVNPLCEGEYEEGDSGQIVRYVAIKRIYVTSSQERIESELQLLHTLSGCHRVVPIITAIRKKDQILAIMPYFPHHNFYTIMDEISLQDISLYMRQLLEALEFVHSKRIIHRDVKPTNFLYNLQTKQGLLVDFGLAENERPRRDKECVCRKGGVNTYADQLRPMKGYLLDDNRPTRRANRAGTRGYRAPEVLLKCQSQTTKIDIWAAGMTLLSLLTKRMPFFTSKDDGEALLELAMLFGRRKLQETALLHGSMFETNIPDIRENYSIERVVYNILKSEFTKLGGDIEKINNFLSKEERAAIKLLSGLLDLDYNRRLNARDALKHPFFRIFGEKA